MILMLFTCTSVVLSFIKSSSEGDITDIREPLLGFEELGARLDLGIPVFT